MRPVREFNRKYRHYILYALFGIPTVAVNVAAYHLFFSALGLSNVVSTALAQLIATGVAFVTNKLWVFESRAFDRRTLAREIGAFYGARLITGMLDVLIMYLAVDIFDSNPTAWKLISNAVVIVLNYAASRWVIFKNDSGDAGRGDARPPEEERKI